MTTVNEFYSSEIYIDIPINGYLGYFVLGYYLRIVQVKKSIRWCMYFLGGLSLLFTIYGTYAMTKANAGEFYPFFYSNYSLTTVFVAIAIFLLMKQLHITVGTIVVQRLVGTTFGIYLVHAFILHFFVTNSLHLSDLSNWLSIPLTAIIVFGASAVVSYIIGKIPFLNKMMP